ncbi:MAG: GTPase HflX [Nitrospirae bacterium]|nr:GTPase HflX [Nitrospirota bacterium]
MDKLITNDLALELAAYSHELGRQLAVIIDRASVICEVIVGDSGGIMIPELSDYPLGRKPLRGLRLIHTHLKNEPLTTDDLTDLALLRLDFIAAIGVKNGLPDRFYTAYLKPGPGSLHEVSNVNFYNFHLDFQSFIRNLEDELEKERSIIKNDTREKAILISVSDKQISEQEESLDELMELAHSSNVNVIGRVVQRPRNFNPKYLIGSGKIKELIIDALNKGTDMLIFDQNLSPAQTKAVTDLTELKVIDRTQLILDIFASRAKSRDGKVQVELAQLKYRLSHLTGKGTAMSRLAGGIGGRGPGEMKLEIDRRRIRDKINLLEKELKKLSLARDQRRHRRSKNSIPIVSIVGYTNAGKSTLLNSLTKSNTFVEDKMFATLDTASRRLRFPREKEVLITDTVGFIMDLPEELMAAFKATLEELEDAALFLHLVDISNPRFERHMESVEKIFKELKLSDKPQIIVFNKADKVSKEEADNSALRFNAELISALDRSTFIKLLDEIELRIFFKGTRPLDPLILY